MRKYFLLLLLVVFSSGWSPADVIPAYKNLRTDIVAQLNELFDREVSVESVSGILVNQIELNNVSIAKDKLLKDGTIIKAKKIVLNYNPFKLAASRGDIAAAISKIVVIEPDILVERSARDEWNMAGLIPKIKSVDAPAGATPLVINATVLIRGGFGSYVDHMGFGEDLKGKAFVSGIRDLNAEVKISGNRINISSVTATSVIGRSLAYAKVNGNLNTRTGKYRFVVAANNVDIEKWGYYTLNIPHFKPLSGFSDMKMILTNPPPRKKGQPILLDGKFTIRGGKAIVFERFIENMNGFIDIFDEDAKFRNMTGYKNNVFLTANGRLYDFTIANYDINIDLAKTNVRKIKSAFPETSGIDFDGDAGAAIHVGGNYGHPVFDGNIRVEGGLLGQKLEGDLGISFEGTVMHLNSESISAFGGKLYAAGIFDFATSAPNMDLHISGESVSIKDALQFIPLREKADVQLSVKGSTNHLAIEGKAGTKNKGEVSASGTYASGNISLMLSAAGMKIDHEYFKGTLESFTGKLSGDLNKKNDLALEGDLLLVNSSAGIQPISEANAKFRLKDNILDLISLVLQTGTSRIDITGRTGSGCKTDLSIKAVSAEASDLKILEAIMPKEVLPIYGKLDLSLQVVGDISREARIDPAYFSLSGDISLREGTMSYETIKEANVSMHWSNGLLIFNRSRIKTLMSDLTFSGTYETKGKVNMDVAGNLDLANLKPFTLKYGRLFGVSKIACRIEGDINNPGFDIEFDVKKLRYNEIIIDRVAGRAVYNGKAVDLVKPLEIVQGNDKYVLSGNFSLLNGPLLSLRFEVLNGDLNTAVALLDQINTELSTKQIFGPIASQKSLMLNPSKFKFPGKSFTQLYRSGGDKTQAEEIKKAESESSMFGKNIKEKGAIPVAGKFSGYVDIKGSPANPSGELSLKVSGGTWESYTFNEAMIKGRLENGTFEAESVYIKKGGGVLSAYGRYNPAGTVSIEITAREMPIDILSLIFGEGKSFEGKFKMDAYLRGPVSSPSGRAEITADKMSIAGIAIDRLNSSISYSKNTLFFRDTDLIVGGKKASLGGQLPLEKDGISIYVTMEGESLGLLSLASKDVSWIRGSGRGYVKISGKLSHPRFDGSLAIDDAAVTIKAIGSNLEAVSSSIKIKNNAISTDDLSAKWIGEWTQGRSNKIKFSGSIDMDGLFLKERSMNFDLRSRDGEFTTDLPNLFKGDMQVTGMSFRGPLSFSREFFGAPKLSGVFNLSNGMIILPDMSKKNKLPPMELDITLNIQKNTYVVAGDIKNLISTDFSNLLLNLEIEGQNIAISGRLDDPLITGKTLFKRGTVNILNREFSLMTEDRQKSIYASDLEKVKENSAVFSGGSLPNLSLSSEIKVKSTEKIAETAIPGEPPKVASYKTTNVLVISRITGTPFSEDKDLGIKLAFDSFIEDTTKQPSEFTPGKYDEEEIKVLLLPDFIKGPLGITDKGVEQVDANGVLADYLNSRLNSYLLRNVERDLAKSLDLESLTLEYNFGKDLRNMLPSKSPTEYGQMQAPETMYGIGAVKGFFERFYIDVKYSQAVQEEAVINKAWLNYQLTYKLNPVMSVVYYREPFSFLEQESDYYKVTLKAGYQL